MKIRTAEATPQDMAAIRALSYELDVIEQQNQPEHFGIVERTDEVLLKHINSNKADYLLAEEDGAVIGFMLVEEQEIGPGESGLIPHKFAYAYELIVSANARQGGYGKALLQAAKDWAKNRKLPYFRLSVLPANTKAMEFYKKMDMEVCLINMECKF